MVIPPVYVEFPQSGKPKELISKGREISIDDVELEKRFDDIIPVQSDGCCSVDCQSW